MSDLGELGLSSYEEKVYRALLSLGSATADAASEASGVPMGRIYDVLNGLDARDIVRSQSTDPTTYAAVDPETAAERLLAERRRELDTRAERYEEIAAGIGPELAATMPAESRFWAAPLGSDTAVSLERDLFAAADGTVRSAMSYPYAAAPWERYEPEVDPFYDALEPDVEVQLLGHAAMLDAAPPEVVAETVDSPSNVSLRVTTDLEATFDVVDGDEVCFHVPHPLDSGERLGVIHVRDGSMAGRLTEVFDRAWAEAEPLSTVVESEVRAERGPR
ncbi:TrmB family transcriptional regulator [Halosimplex salinum]|uniref:TrmB family transcriptional regulator n=1 Tax=Halosimplex salinum TaxID=1710538 RepID=UPI000F4800B7|nr:helix-turn-helix domain-containing protein [Halosimplex salinum]